MKNFKATSYRYLDEDPAYAALPPTTSHAPENPALTPSSRYTISRSRANSETLTVSPLSQQPTDSFDQGGQRWRGIRNAFSRWRRHGVESRHSSPSSGVASDDSFGDPQLSPTSVQSEKFQISCSSRTRVFAHPHRGPVVNPQSNIYSRLPPIHSNKHFSFVRALRRRKLREKSKSDQDLHGSKLNIPPSTGSKDDSGLTVFATVRLPKDRRETPSIFSTFWNIRSNPRRCEASLYTSERSCLKEQESDGTQLTPVPLPRRASKDSRCGTPFLSIRPRSRSLERFSSARIFPSISGLGTSSRSRSLERNQKFQTERKDSLTPSCSGTLAPKKRSRSVENASRIHPCDELALGRTNVTKFSSSQVGQWKTFSEVFGASSEQKKGPISSAFQDLLLSHQSNQTSSTIVCGDREAPILGRHLVAGGEIIVAWLPTEGPMEAGAMESSGGGLMNKPSRGWLHHDQQLVRDGIAYLVQYVGCVSVNTSMKSLDFDTRSLIAKECINRVCEAAGVRSIGRKKPTDRKLLKILGDRPILTNGGSDVTLVVNSTCLKLTTRDGTPIACHEMPNISFASGGDPETLDFVAYVAKDPRYGRSCFVLKCAEGLAQDVITTVGQAFELRFKEYLKRAPKSQPETVPKPPMDDPDYYNDLPGKVPPELTTSGTPLPSATLKRPSSLEVSDDVWNGDRADAVHPRISPQPPRISPLPSTSSQSAAATQQSIPTGSVGSAGQKTKKENNLIDFSSETAPSGGVPKFVSHDYINTTPSVSSPAPEDPFDANQLHNSLPSPLVPPPKISHSLPSTSSGLPPRLAPSVQKNQLLQEVWYHGPISRKDAEALLKNDGEFLVRESQGTAGQYVLSGFQHGNHKHLLLVDPEGVVRTKDRVFDSVSHLINYHCNNALPIVSAESALVLQTPVRRMTQLK